jgi:hypothetical protein
LSVTTVETYVVDGIPFECDMSANGRIAIGKLVIHLGKPFALSRNLRKKISTALRQQHYVNDADASGNSIACTCNMASNRIGIQGILLVIARVVNDSGKGSRHASSPCYIKQRRRTRPAVTQRQARSKKKGKKSTDEADRLMTTGLSRPMPINVRALLRY